MLVRFTIHVLALLFVFYVVWSIHSTRILGAAVILALILALVNAVLRPILLILTLPVTILTLGLFIIILNALLFGLSLAILSALGYHFVVSFGQIVIGWLIYVVISWALTHVIR